MNMQAPPPSPDEAGQTLAAIEQERIRSFVEWGEADVPRWYWPVYGVAIAAFIAVYRFGPVWGTVGAIIFAAVMGVMIGAATSRTGVSMPRFRAMPGRLRKTFLPIFVGVVVSLGTLGTVLLISDEAPLILLGVGIGTCMAVAGWVHTLWYRREAQRLAAEHGLQR